MDVLTFVVFLLLRHISFIYAGNISLGNSSRPKEYCTVDGFFEPRCETTEIISIRSARFGRMHKGRCIDDDLGSIGCSADALGLLDNKCSGRRSCQVLVPKIEQFIHSACPKGFIQYLEVDYECINVAYPPKGYCDSHTPTDVDGPRGFLSSLVTQETGCGSRNTPWRVTTQPGQRFRIKLINSYYEDETSEECGSYVLIDEEPNFSQTLCAGRARDSPVFTSKSNSVQLRIMTEVHETTETNYVIVEFEAFGCSDRKPPENGWVKRTGETLLFGCNATIEHVHQWEMKCNSSRWIGVEHNCTIALSTTTRQSSEKPTTQPEIREPSPFGLQSTMSILVIAGLAILVLLCSVLSCMAIYIVRYRKRERRAPCQDIISDYDADNRRPPTIEQTSLKRNGRDRNSSSETDNYWTWQNNQNDQRRNNLPEGPSSQHGTICSMSAHRRQAPEESTMLVRKIDDGKHHRRNDRKATDYDQLDPEFMVAGCVERGNVDYDA